MHRALIFFLMVATAVAAPPPGVDPASPTHHWFEAQHALSGAWCCNVSDGHLLDDDAWRSNGASYEVRIDGRWYPIPSDALRDPRGGPNPTGKAIVWYTENEFGVLIYCFAPGFEF